MRSDHELLLACSTLTRKNVPILKHQLNAAVLEPFISASIIKKFQNYVEKKKKKPVPQKKQREVESDEEYNEQFPSEVRAPISLALTRMSAKAAAKQRAEHHPITLQNSSHRLYTS